MGMSYKRAWLLVEEMNGVFLEPLVISSRGGPGGGGAHLTKTGARVLGLYDDIVETAQAAAASSIESLEAMLRASGAPDSSERS